MPTTPSLVVRTAERPGGDRPSEDRIFATDNAVIVLDGATQYLNHERDGGWIAEQLGQLLTNGLTLDPAIDLVHLLEQSIATLVDEYQLTPGASPSTTVNIVRAIDDVLDVLVLCDSPVIVLGTNGQVHEIRDDRLAETMGRLQRPSGRVDLNQQIWRDLLAQFEALRNHPNGFWAASATPEAARYAVLARFPISDIDLALAMTDGVAAGVDEYGEPPDWTTAAAIARTRPADLIDLVHRVELTDPDTTRWPRSKCHDDKAIAVVGLAPRA